MGQGTLRPDLIESASGIASGQADLIKTHHNDTELVRKLRDQNRVVEPLAEFHKDEVSNFGLLLKHSKWEQIEKQYEPYIFTYSYYHKVHINQHQLTS